MSSSYSINGFADTGFVFALDGDEMRTHKGRSVVAITVDERIHYLKRFWFTPSQLFKRHVARGFHELRMIDWLNANGFAGPKVVRRGHSRFGPLIRRMFFLMEEVPGECALEAAWRHVDARTDDLIQQLADFAARLHDAHFVHTDFSERHILVSEHGDQFGFRLIDVERASVGHAPPMRAAADIATLHASVCDDGLRDAIMGDFLAQYVERRKALASLHEFAEMVRAAKPTKSFN